MLLFKLFFAREGAAGAALAAAHDGGLLLRAHCLWLVLASPVLLPHAAAAEAAGDEAAAGSCR
jgi:hypothetical protein